MGGLLRILVIALLIGYGVKFILKLISPYKSNHYKTEQQQKERSEGEVTVHYDKQRQQDSSRREKKGDYVDYEEVK